MNRSLLLCSLLFVTACDKKDATAPASATAAAAKPTAQKPSIDCAGLDPQLQALGMRLAQLPSVVNLIDDEERLRAFKTIRDDLKVASQVPDAPEPLFIPLSRAVAQVEEVLDKVDRLVDTPMAERRPLATEIARGGMTAMQSFVTELSTALDAAGCRQTK